MALRTIWTIGHSNHDVEYFISMLRECSLSLLADVRRFPGSRRQVQYQQQNLEQALAAVGIAYRHFQDLGGRRSARASNSPNVAWRVESFNAYADHMRTGEFQEALEELERAASVEATAIMCSEAVPWRCHRRLIADALLARGWTVLDIFSPSRVKPHELTPFAHVEQGEVTYPAEAENE